MINLLLNMTDIFALITVLLRVHFTVIFSNKDSSMRTFSSMETFIIQDESGLLSYPLQASQKELEM